MNSLTKSKQVMMDETITNLDNELYTSVLNASISASLCSVLTDEILALENLVQALPPSANQLVTLILATTGRVVFSGIGKSGLIARKLVATFSSMGKASLFLHPTDALHGDLGMVHPTDLLIILSKSGTGQEFEQILQVLTLQQNKTALICCNKGILYERVTLPVLLPFEREACSLNLAPTSSSTLMLAFGDALALTVANISGFKKQDFARFHPAGALGKNLLLTVHSLMHPHKKLPLIEPQSSFQETILTITSKKLGVGIIVTPETNKLLGIITDGDLRRACNLGPLLFKKQASDLMTLNPKTIPPDMLALTALEIMEEFNITSLVVAKDQTVLGLIHIHDLMRAGITQNKERS